MLSARSLSAEAHRVVIRGVERLRKIRLAHELAEQQLLEARQEDVAILTGVYFPESEDGDWVPSPAEIERRAEEIQAGWTPEDREQRWRPHTRFIHLARRDRDRQRKYYRTHRDLVRAKAADPERREYVRNWQEANREHIREQRRAKADERNAARRVKRQTVKELIESGDPAAIAKAAAEREWKRDWARRLRERAAVGDPAAVAAVEEKNRQNREYAARARRVAV